MDAATRASADVNEITRAAAGPQEFGEPGNWSCLPLLPLQSLMISVLGSLDSHLSEVY